MSRVADLWALQTTDLALDAIKQRLAELEKQMNDRTELDAAAAAAAAAEAELERSRSQQRELDQQIKELSNHIRAAERELMSGRVRSARELEGMEANVASLKRRRSALEDEVLAVMLEIETWQPMVEARRATRADAEAAHRQQQEAIRREAAQKIAEFKALSARHNQQWAAIEPADRELYKNLRSRKGGRAVAREQNGACQACGLMLPTGVVQAVHSGRENVFCPGCGRLLLAG